MTEICLEIHLKIQVYIRRRTCKYTYVILFLFSRESAPSTLDESRDYKLHARLSTHAEYNKLKLTSPYCFDDFPLHVQEFRLFLVEDVLEVQTSTAKFRLFQKVRFLILNTQSRFVLGKDKWILGRYKDFRLAIR